MLRITPGLQVQRLTVPAVATLSQLSGRARSSAVIDQFEGGNPSPAASLPPGTEKHILLIICQATAMAWRRRTPQSAHLRAGSWGPPLGIDPIPTAVTTDASPDQPNKVLQRVVQICVISPGLYGRAPREWPGSGTEKWRAQGKQRGELLLRAAGRGEVLRS